MNTHGLVDPELRPLLAAWPTATYSTESLAGLRVRELPPPISTEGSTLERRTVSGPTGAPDIGLDIYRPANATGQVSCIYHIHGGGYVVGHAREFEFLHRPMVATLGCALVSVDYRLAPETVFPGAIEDCYAGLAWLYANAAALGIDPARIGVMGESAGGGFAAALALLARDRGEFPLAFQHLVAPMLDDRTGTTVNPHPYAGEFVWTPQSNRFGWRSLLGQEPGGGDVSPYAAAARGENLAGLPPAFISAGALDLFVEEDMEYARRLLRAGVPTELHVYPGGFHGFDLLPGAAVSAQAAADRIVALRQALA